MAVRKAPSKGSKPDKLMRDALLLALNREAEDANGQPTKKLALIADRLVDKAVEGDMNAIKEIIDRVDGKTGQTASAGAPAPQALEDLLERLSGLAEDT